MQQPVTQAHCLHRQLKSSSTAGLHLSRNSTPTLARFAVLGETALFEEICTAQFSVKLLHFNELQYA